MTAAVQPVIMTADLNRTLGVRAGADGRENPARACQPAEGRSDCGSEQLCGAGGRAGHDSPVRRSSRG